MLVLRRGLDLAAPLIASEKVSKSFGPTEVLRHVSLAVAPKDVVCVIGPSGSGKTTLLRCLALLEQPTDGSVAMNGVTIASARNSSEERRAAREVRPDIGMVFQHFTLWPHMTVLGNLIEAPLRVKRMPRAEAIAMAEALLAKVGLSDKRDVYPNRLSGGQQQRVAIARALSCEPQLLLIDEPTLKVSYPARDPLLRLLKTLADDGLAVLSTTSEGTGVLGATRVLSLDRGMLRGELVPELAPITNIAQRRHAG